MAGDQTVLELIETMQEVSRLPLHAHLSAMARGELFVLRFLERHEGTAFPADLCQVMDVSKARVSVALHMLEEKGLIRKEEDGQDRRRIRIRITPEGMRYMQESREAAYQEAKRFFAKLGEEDAREYVRLMRRMLEIAREGSASPCN